MSVQLKETNGELPFDESNYHCAEYRNLMKNVSDLRQKYQSSSDSDERKQLASKEAFHWYNYLENREQALPESYKMSNTTLSLLEESFERESERRNKKIRSDRIVDFHYSYAKVRRFDIPIHSRNLIQMIHPYNGYLCNIPDKVFTFEEIIKIYRQQLVSSYERNLGQTLLADELACLSYWNIIDEQKQGYMDLDSFVRVLKMFRFNLNTWTQDSIKAEFEWILKYNKLDLTYPTYNFARLIFLERQL